MIDYIGIIGIFIHPEFIIMYNTGGHSEYFKNYKYLHEGWINTKYILNKIL